MNFSFRGRDHLAKRRSGQTLFVAHVEVNHREGVSAVSLLFNLANDRYVGITKWTYIAEKTTEACPVGSQITKCFNGGIKEN